MACPTIALLAVGLCFAGDTRFWSQSDYSDFEKGNLKGLSLRSDGRLTLAPVSKELFDSSTAYLWTLARDSHGVIYAGGGPGANLFRINANGGGSKIAEFDALEIHAIAIDSENRVYVGTSPDGKVYRLDTNAKPEVFYDPKQKYIWGMVFGPNGDLYIATGDAGEIHRVTPDGKGSVFFKSEETHARSLALDGKGNLIVGTEPGGLVLRIDGKGDGFVLYQMPKRETTAVAVAPDGSIYAAGVGTKQAVQTPVVQPQVKPVDAPQLSAAGTVVIHSVASEPPPTLAPAARTGVSGGSEVWRIYPDGHPERVFSNSQDVIYAIAFDSGGQPIIGSGNKGTLYRIDTPSRYTSLLSLSLNQITALETTKDGAILACTGNVGKVFQFGPEMEKSGSIESDVFDAGGYAYWGRIEGDGDRHGGTVKLEARSGNLDRPQKNWSPWSAPVTAVEGGKITAPAARFLQWKATLTAAGNGTSPNLDVVDAAYLLKNVAPRVSEIEITPDNYKYAAPAVTLNPSALQVSISLPPIGRKNSSFTGSDSDSGGQSMSYAKGWLGARWNASDENGDDLEYTVEIRGAKETEWKLVKDKLRERHFSFDSTAFPDGEYRLRVMASDAPSNTPQDALTGELQSEEFTIDNTPPVITGLAAMPAAGGLRVRWRAADALSNVKHAEYSLDGGDWTRVDPVGRLSDSKAEDYDVTMAASAGREHTVAVRVADDDENQAVEKVVTR
jgi:WD40 repeat protein